MPPLHLGAADLVALGLRHLGLCRRPERPENKVRANLPGRTEGGSNACATHASVAPPCSAAFSLPPVPRCHAPVRRGAGAGVAYVRVPELRPLGKSHELHWQVADNLREGIGAQAKRITERPAESAYSLIHFILSQGSQRNTSA